MIVAALAEIAAGRARAAPQPAEGATYARKIDKREALLDWSQPGARARARGARLSVRRPAPRTLLEGEPLKIWRARVADGSGAPGEVLAARPTSWSSPAARARSRSSSCSAPAASA